MATRHSTSISYPHQLHDGSIQIPLTKGYVTVVDPEDADLAQSRWYADRHTPTLIYARRAITVGRRQQKVSMHRIILSRALGHELPTNVHVDHIDGDGLNNRRFNLRAATPMQNTHNQRLSSRNTSGYKGVGRLQRTDKWTAKIRINKRVTWLGSFDTQELAHAAYCKAAKDHFGEFARPTNNVNLDQLVRRLRPMAESMGNQTWIVGDWRLYVVQVELPDSIKSAHRRSDMERWQWNVRFAPVGWEEWAETDAGREQAIIEALNTIQSIGSGQYVTRYAVDVMGEIVTPEVKPTMLISDFIPLALAATGHPNYNPDEWEITGEGGHIYPRHLPIGITSHRPISLDPLHLTAS